MAYTSEVSFDNGDQLTQLKLKSQVAFGEVITNTAVTALLTVGSGQGLQQFRKVCNSNIGTINTALTKTYPEIGPGHTVWDCRLILGDMFAAIEAIV